jgi:hypothetical protein
MFYWRNQFWWISHEIYILFYSNSFSYTDGTSRFYLFGEHENVEEQYCHKLYYFVNSEIVQESDGYAFNKLSLKINPSLQVEFSSHFLSFEGTYNNFLKNVNFADIELYVDGQVCENPTASISFDSFTNHSIELFNLDLNNWTQGNLMANFVWNLNLLNSEETFQIYENDIKVATIGWGNHWLHWK